MFLARDHDVWENLEERYLSVAFLFPKSEGQEIILQDWTVGEKNGVPVVVAPEKLFQELHRPHLGPRVTLEPTDTRTIIETMMGLWTDGGRGKLGYLDAALEAARALHA